MAFTPSASAAAGHWRAADHSVAAAQRSRRRSHQEDALAGALAVEQPIGLLGLIERPAMGEQAVDVDPASRDEVGAFGLADAREGPGRDQGELLTQEVAADVERDAAA